MSSVLKITLLVFPSERGVCFRQVGPSGALPSNQTKLFPTVICFHGPRDPSYNFLSNCHPAKIFPFFLLPIFHNEDSLSILLNIVFHAPMGRFQLELIYYFTYFSPSSHSALVCFFPVGLSFLIQHFQQKTTIEK